MIGARTKRNVAAWHRWLGLGLTLPLLGWVVSAAVMMLVTMNAQNGLAGSYELNPHNSIDVPLSEASVSPSAMLAKLAAEHSIERVYWLRLQSRGAHLWYVVKPTPYALAMVFDARTGQRLDPLSDELLTVVAGEALVGSHVSSLTPASEYNRYYAAPRLEAVRAKLAGAQSAQLILSRDEGRTLRRLNADSERFEWWYRTFHVNQLTTHLWPWTTLLYLCAAGVMVLAALGYLLFWWRRPRGAVRASDPQQETARWSVRILHRRLGAVAGGILTIQVLVGAYLWLNLGPLEDPFRGKSSFHADWNGGFSTGRPLATAAEVLARLSNVLPNSSRPVQAIEWRVLGENDVWVVTPRLDEAPRVFDSDGAPIESLDPAEAGEIARREVIGNPSFVFVGSEPQLYMDLNRPVPTYRFRFDDPGKTDVYVATNTGQIIQRRPRIWRWFGPLLAVHMIEVTGNKSVDVVLLAAFQLLVLGMIATGLTVFLRSRPAGGA